MQYILLQYKQCNILHCYNVQYNILNCYNVQYNILYCKRQQYQYNCPYPCEQWQIIPDTTKRYWSKLREGEKADVNRIPKLLWGKMNAEEQREYVEAENPQRYTPEWSKGRKGGKDIPINHKGNVPQVSKGDIEEGNTSDYLEYLRAINNTNTEQSSSLCAILYNIGRSMCDWFDIFSNASVGKVTIGKQYISCIFGSKVD